MINHSDFNTVDTNTQYMIETYGSFTVGCGIVLFTSLIVCFLVSYIYQHR